MKDSQKKNILTYLIAFCIILFLALGIYLYFSPSSSSDEVLGEVKAEKLHIDERGLSHTSAVLKTVHGNIVFKFYPEKAPNTVHRILTLIQDGFYDGLEFHKVIPGFVAQTGDPTATGTGGSGQSLKAELNDVPHIKGTLGMARANDINSASSQFYIALTRLPHLDHKYTVFAQVVSGLNLLDKIVKGDKIISLTVRVPMVEK